MPNVDIEKLFAGRPNYPLTNVQRRGFSDCPTTVSLELVAKFQTSFDADPVDAVYKVLFG